MMPVIDRWVVNHVIEALQAARRGARGRALGFAINFSGQSLERRRLRRLADRAHRRSGLDPDLLCFELTENATVAQPFARRGADAAPAHLGCGVALDDFGTGLSSLSCLRSCRSPCSRSTAASCATCSRTRARSRWCAPSRSSPAACRSPRWPSTSRPRRSASASPSSASTTARDSPSAAPSRSRTCSRSCRCRAPRPEAAEPAADTDEHVVRAGR